MRESPVTALVRCRVSPKREWRNRAVVDGLVVSDAAIDIQQAAQILAGSAPFAVGSRTYRWNVTFPPGALQSFSVEPGSVRTESPGSFGSVSVKGTLNLTTGTYTFDNLGLEPGSRIVLDDTTGPVYLYIKNSLTYRGRIEGLSTIPGNYLVGVAGPDAHIESPFTGGALVVPNGKITIDSTQDVHRGSFFGSRVEVHQGATVAHVPSPAIGGITTKALTPLGCGARMSKRAVSGRPWSLCFPDRSGRPMRRGRRRTISLRGRAHLPGWHLSAGPRHRRRLQYR